MSRWRASAAATPSLKRSRRRASETLLSGHEVSVEHPKFSGPVNLAAKPTAMLIISIIVGVLVVLIVAGVLVARRRQAARRGPW